MKTGSAFKGNTRTGIGLMLLLLTGFSIYLPTTGIKPSGDDFDKFLPSIIASETSWPALFSPLIRPIPYNMYRPGGAWVLQGLGERLFGNGAQGGQWIKLAVYLASLMLIYRIARRLFDGSIPALLAMGLTIFHPQMHAAIASIDGTADVVSTFFLLVAVLAMLRATQEPGSYDNLIIGLATIGGLMFKENAVAIPACLGILLLARADWMRNRRLWLGVMLSAIIVLIYIAIRIVAGLTIPGSGRYALSLLNIPVNLALLVGGAVVTTNTVTIYTERGIYLVWGAISGLVLFLPISLGLFSVQSRNRKHDLRLTLMLVLAAVFSQVPSLLMEHISEMHLYRSLPFLCMVAAIGLTRAFNATSRVLRALVISTLLVFLLTGLNSIDAKQEFLYDNGARANRMLMQIRRAVPDPEKRSKFWLIPDRSTGEIREYSIYQQKANTIIAYNPVTYLYRRSDLLSIVEPTKTDTQGVKVYYFRIMPGDSILYLGR
ncbi:MAG: glycosyltransferase family 39 protein [Calditrichaeota bacterium]|nr:glycosyltransferase family 39 protein [Calditrichota bacterium]